MFLKGKKNTNRRTNISSSVLPPRALGYAFWRCEGKRKLLFCRLYQHTKPTHIVEMYEREHCQMWMELEWSLSLRGFGAAAHPLASVTNAPTLNHELLCTCLEPMPMASSLWNLPQSTLIWTVFFLPQHPPCLALLHLVFNCKFNTISSRGHFPTQVKNLFIVLFHSPLCNLHGSWNYLPNINHLFY